MKKYLIIVVTLSLGLFTLSTYAYEATDHDIQLLEQVDTKLSRLKSLSPQNVEQFFVVQEKLTRLLNKWEGDERVTYILNEIVVLLGRHIQEAEIGQKYTTRIQHHIFEYLSIEDIHIENYIENEGPIFGEPPEFSLSIQNGTGKSIIGDFSTACGKEGFVLYETPRSKKISISGNGSTTTNVTYIDPALQEAMNQTGTITIECRVYDISYTKDYISRTLSFTIVEPPTSYWDISLETITQVRSTSGLSQEEREEVSEKVVLSLFFKNSGNVGFTGNVGVACYTPAIRKNIDNAENHQERTNLQELGSVSSTTAKSQNEETTEASYTNIPVELPAGKSVSGKLVINYDDVYKKLKTIECRLNPENMSPHFLKDDISIDVVKLTIK